MRTTQSSTRPCPRWNRVYKPSTTSASRFVFGCGPEKNRQRGREKFAERISTFTSLQELEREKQKLAAEKAAFERERTLFSRRASEIAYVTRCPF